MRNIQSQTIDALVTETEDEANEAILYVSMEELLAYAIVTAEEESGIAGEDCFAIFEPIDNSISVYELAEPVENDLGEGEIRLKNGVSLEFKDMTIVQAGNSSKSKQLRDAKHAKTSKRFSNPDSWYKKALRTERTRA